MITEATKCVINKFVDEYISETNFEIILLDRDREINEISPGKYLVRDLDIFIDRNQNFKKVLEHPIEDFFIPEVAELFGTEFIVELKLPALEDLNNFEVKEILIQETVPIEDIKLSDEQVMLLLNSTCFDKSYQDSFPEVRSYLEAVYKTDHKQGIKNFLDRIHPLLGL